LQLPLSQWAMITSYSPPETRRYGKSPLVDIAYDKSTTEFEHVLLRSTIFRAAKLDSKPGKIETTIFQVSTIPRISSKPTFAIAHILCPHPPYDFVPTTVEAIDGSEWDGNLWTDRAAYANEIDVLNEKILNMVTES
jgi:hypothetical protein